MSAPAPLDFIAALIELTAELPTQYDRDPALPSDSRMYWMGFNAGVAAAREYLGAALRLFVGDGTPSVEIDALLLAKAHEMIAIRGQVAAGHQLEHHDSCDPGDRCVYCDGCDCGAVEPICGGPAGSTDSCYPAAEAVDRG